MTSYDSANGVDFGLNKRHLPRSQTEAIPTVDVDSEEDIPASLTPSSLRANFILPGSDFGVADPSTIGYYGSYRGESLLSPVYSELQAVNPERLRAASPEAQTLRRKLMRGSNILIVQGGYSGKRYIYKILKELGVNVTILDGPDSVWRNAAEEGLIVDFIELDFTENETIFQRAMDAVADSLQDIVYDAVTTYFEDAVALAARIATALGIAVNPVEACDKARNKRRTREVMQEAGIPVPKFMRVLKEDDIASACKHVGFPAILKPAFGAASMGVTRIESTDEAIESYKKLFGTLNVEDDTIWAQGTEMVIEEYYDGDEFDIDLLLSDGEVVYAKVSDNWACWEPWFQETGTNCPSLYPIEKQRELIALASDTTLALGFKCGCFHVECKYTVHGPRMIEVNARMGGVSVRDANLIAWGVDLVEEHAMAALRIPIRPVVPEKPLKYMAECAVNAPFSGIINSEEFLNYLTEDPRLQVNYFMKKGSKVVGPEDGVPDWILEIISINDNSQEENIELIRSIMEGRKASNITSSVSGAERPYFLPSHAFPFSRK